LDYVHQQQTAEINLIETSWICRYMKILFKQTD